MYLILYKVSKLDVVLKVNLYFVDNMWGIYSNATLQINTCLTQLVFTYKSLFIIILFRI